MKLPVSFRFDTELMARVDLARGDVPRVVWVARALERELERHDEYLKRVAAIEAPRSFEQEKPASIPRLPSSLSRGSLRRDVTPFQRGG